MGGAAKDAASRRREADMLRAQLEDLGVAAETLALHGVAAALDEFADRGWGLTRTFRLPEAGIAVTLLLSTQARVTSYARVRKA